MLVWWILTLAAFVWGCHFLSEATKWFHLHRINLPLISAFRFHEGISLSLWQKRDRKCRPWFTLGVSIVSKWESESHSESSVARPVERCWKQWILLSTLTCCLWNCWYRKVVCHQVFTEVSAAMRAKDGIQVITPTGNVAYLVQGSTAHNFLGIPKGGRSRNELTVPSGSWLEKIQKKC